ncbi:MAG: agmatine deiminase family protein [Mycobacteriaceae bacterium]
MQYVSRRTLLKASALTTLGAAGLAACSTDSQTADRPSPNTSVAPPVPQGLRMPAESLPHKRTFMSWPPLNSVWEGSDGPAVQEDIARVARAISQFEPVVLLASTQEAASARRACGSEIEVLEIPTDDLWVRDSGPTFVLGPNGLSGIDFHFNGWGNKQEHSRDSSVASEILSHFAIPRIDPALIAEGGSLEIDGEGTLLVTKSSLVIDNRNPGKSQDQIEQSLKELLGVSKVIWVNGIQGKDITDFHIDALARFAGPGVVALSKPATTGDIWWQAYEQARGILENTTDAQGRSINIVELPEPDPENLGERGDSFLGTYANYYVVNDGVIVPEFGDKTADANAVSIVAELHPGRRVVQVDINVIAEGGGGIHCATQQQPMI